MKFCSHCGKEIHEDAQVCMNCGCSVVENKVKTQSNVKKNNNGKYNPLKIISLIMFIVCLVALIGHTFAWFFDESYSQTYAEYFFGEECHISFGYFQYCYQYLFGTLLSLYLFFKNK